MSLSSKQIREFEARTHEKLYNNIQLLTYIYPTTKEFDSVFEKNMFAKSNKVGFQQVIYYLLNILNPKLTKEKITTWPLYDVRLEGTFRNQVLALINQINIKYKHAGIPNLMASHLVTPAGFKFVSFMLKLSNLVIYEHLKKNNKIKQELIGPIQPSKDPRVTKIVINNLKKETNRINIRIQEMYEKFSATYEKAVQEADVIKNEQSQIKMLGSNFNKMLQEKKKTRGDLGSVQTLNDRLENFNGKMEAMKHIKNLCEKGVECLTYLSSDEPILEFKKDDLRVPASVQHLMNTDDNVLDLHNLFNSLHVLLENEGLEIPILTIQQLSEMTKAVSELNEKYAFLDNNLTFNRNELVEFAQNFASEHDTFKAKFPNIVVIPAE